MNNNKLILWLPYLVFFTGSFIYFGFFADYIFFYQEKSSLFVLSWEYLIENLNQPGGLLIYLGKFLSAFYYYPVAGAFIVTSSTTLIIIIASKITGLLTGRTSKIVPFIIGAIIFYVQTDYHCILVNNLGLLIQVVLFYVTIKYSKPLKGWIPVLVTPLWYYATGGFAWLFSILLSFYFAFYSENKGWIKIAALWCINLLTFWIFREYLFFQTGKTLLTFPFSEINTGSHPKLFLSAAFILSLIPLLSKIRINLPVKMRVSELTGTLIISLLLIIFLVRTGVHQSDKKIKQYFHVEKLFYQDRFNDIIAYNTLNPPTNSLTVFFNNIALCETGKLIDMLFHFRQSPDGSTLFLKWEMVEEILKRGGYFYYTIGMINEAHRWAFENMVMKGHSPEGLKMLIRTELINGNYMTASKYINLLKKSFFYKKEALAYGKLLFDDNAVGADPELGEKRKNRLETDFFSITDNPYINIERILAADSLNINAFEYRMAFMLLRRNYKGITAALPEFKNFGFTKFPVHIEEAIVALAVLNKGILPDLGNIHLSEETQLRWSQYLSVLQQYGNDPKTAEPALRRQFGDTFWYYVFYR
jgi:hypothetical protein